MNMGSIDTSATLGTSWLHRCSPVSKLVAFALVLTGIVVTWNLFVVLALLAALSAAVVSARLKARLAFGLAAYPALFALIFALASAPGLMTGAVIVSKAVTAALAAVTIVLTTPYPQVFAPVQRVVPVVVGDALLMTYRSVFLLLEKFSNLLRAMRLRAGLVGHSPVPSAVATTRALGGLLLYSIDLSQREYDVMRLRGYERRLVAELPRTERPAIDAAMIATAALLLATSVLWRVGWQALNPYSWIPLAGGVAMLAVALAFRWRKR
jgi:energy-coupling factor transporter transmembrane protein EcfT